MINDILLFTHMLSNEDRQELIRLFNKRARIKRDKN